MEFGNVIVDLGGTEAIIQKNEMIPRENIKAGDRVKAYCLDVRREPKANKYFSQGLITNLWKNYLPKKFQRYMMV